MRHIESSLRRAIVPVLLAIVAADVTAGGMWVSNRDRALAINAWGGAQNGAVLRLAAQRVPPEQSRLHMDLQPRDVTSATGIRGLPSVSIIRPRAGRT